MTKREYERFSAAIEEMSNSDECIEVLENLYFDIKRMVRDYEERKGIKR